METQTQAHGRWRYANAECRCDVCASDWAKYIRSRRQRRGAKARGDRFYAGPYGRHGFSQLAEQVLDVAVKRTGRHWRDVVDQVLREHGTEVQFPASAAVN